MIPAGCHKHGHPTRADALRHLRHVRRELERRPKGGRELEIYKCECGLWHVGHRSPPRPGWKGKRRKGA